MDTEELLGTLGIFLGELPEERCWPSLKKVK